MADAGADAAMSENNTARSDFIDGSSGWAGSVGHCVLSFSLTVIASLPQATGWHAGRMWVETPRRLVCGLSPTPLAT
jgi:hypothetical protein